MIEPRITIKKRVRGYTALITKAKHGYVVQCEQLPEAMTQGETIPETMENLKEAIELVLQTKHIEGVLTYRGCIKRIKK